MLERGMTPVQKGDLGEAAVIKELLRQGFEVFSPVGNGSRIDLVAHRSGHFKRVQVKYANSFNETASLQLRKCTLNPKYNYSYERTDVDLFALFVHDKDTVVFITADEVFGSKTARSSLTFRFAPAKNNQGCRMVEDYLTVPWGV